MTMHRTFNILVAVMALWCLVPADKAAAEVQWTDDFDKAKATAKAQNRFMLLDFTGSDWCGWCIKLNKEVFSTKEFEAYADSKLVCVEVDFPARKKISNKIQKQNMDLQAAYGVKGYPTIILLDPDGNTIGQTGYQAGGSEAYVQHLETFIAPLASKFGAVTEDEPAAAAPTTIARDQLRTWTSVSGSTLEARYYRSVGKMVELRKADGVTVRIDLSSLAEADHTYLRTIKAIP